MVNRYYPVTQGVIYLLIIIIPSGSLSLVERLITID